MDLYPFGASRHLRHPLSVNEQNATSALHSACRSKIDFSLSVHREREGGRERERDRERE